MISRLHFWIIRLLEINFRQLLIVTAITSVTACQAPAQLQEVPSRSQLIPPGFERYGQMNCAIEYLVAFREIHIYGQSGEENSATVSLITHPLGPTVRVELSCGGAVTGTQLVEEFPFLTKWESTPVVPQEPPIAPSPGTPITPGPTPPNPKRLVYDVFFHGSVKEDYFENQTDIPSQANGWSGANTLIGGAGPDRLYGGNDDDVLNGGDGNDRLYGYQGSDQLYGENGNDYLKITTEGVNESDTNLLCGGDGEDHLVGGNNNLDRLDGELAGGSDDGDSDLLENGHQNTGHFTEFEFNTPPDVLVLNDIQLDPESDEFPESNLIPCGSD